jgi:hypothetical protein
VFHGWNLRSSWGRPACHVPGCCKL